MKSAAGLAVILTLVSGISASKCADSIAEAFTTCNNDYDSQVKEYGGNHCCIITRYSYCLKRKTHTECQHNAMRVLAIDLANAKNDAFLSQGCDSQEKYPSTACVFFFYGALFIIGEVLVVGLLVGACIAVEVVRSRRRRIIIKQW